MRARPKPRREPRAIPSEARPALSRRARRLEVSPTVAVAQRAIALKASGVRVFDFSVGEPDQGTPEHVTRAGVRALEAGRTRYTSAAGLGELRGAVSERYRADFGVDFEPGEVAVAVGGKQALYLVAQALLDRGDEAIVPVPTWPTFVEAVRLAEGRPVLVPTSEGDGFRIGAKRLARALTPRTRLVLVNSPSNPTGAVIEPEELLALCRLARRRGFTLLYDDTYAQLAYGPAAPGLLHAAREAAGDRFVVVGTASKTYCMTGWRIGWVLGPRALVDACTALCSHSTQSPSTFAQVAAVEALRGPQDQVAARRDEYRRRRDAFHAALSGVPGVSCGRPDGAFYLFPNVSAALGATNTVAFAQALLEEQAVAVVPGEGFFAPGYLRISFARPLDELLEGARRIAAQLAAAADR